MSKIVKTESFIAKAKIKHGDTYSYDKTNYVGTKQKVTITCPVHGDFEQTPSNHYQFGCIVCGIDKRGEGLRVGWEVALERLQSKHSGRYTYPGFEKNFKLTHAYIDVVCSDHGTFSMKYDNHLSGQECPYCRISDEEGMATLYVVGLSSGSEKFIKIGVTSKTVSNRIKHITKHEKEVLYQKRVNARLALIAERAVKGLVEVYPTQLNNRSGKTECFSLEDLSRVLKILDLYLGNGK